MPKQQTWHWSLTHDTPVSMLSCHVCDYTRIDPLDKGFPFHTCIQKYGTSLWLVCVPEMARNEALLLCDVCKLAREVSKNEIASLASSEWQRGGESTAKLGQKVCNKFQCGFPLAPFSSLWLPKDLFSFVLFFLRDFTFSWPKSCNPGWPKPVGRPETTNYGLASLRDLSWLTIPEYFGTEQHTASDITCCVVFT